MIHLAVPFVTEWTWLGVASVMGTYTIIAVPFVGIALFAGISAAFWTGVVCYVVTLAVFLVLVRRP